MLTRRATTAEVELLATSSLAVATSKAFTLEPCVSPHNQKCKILEVEDIGQEKGLLELESLCTLFRRSKEALV